jgi:tetratricopeptide (TPR) repeat protein
LNEATEAYKQAIASNPFDDEANVELGHIYQDQGRVAESREAFHRAIAVNPKNYRAFGLLRRIYIGQGRFVEAAQACKKAIALNPRMTSWAYAGLAEFYMQSGRLAEAEKILERAQKICPDERNCRTLSLIYRQTGHLAHSDEPCKEAWQSPSAVNDTVVMDNYRRLKEILDKRGIKLVSVQYPMRSVEPLKKMLQGLENGVIFVDNQRVFQEAVRETSYNEYFRDSFGGDFGHCTEKGNRLLAENIAKAILAETLTKRDP